MKDRHMNEFETHLNGRGLKLTYERKMILDEVTRLKGHFDADSLYARFKKKGLRVSRDTVYRTLPLLLESNVIQKSVGDGANVTPDPRPILQDKHAQWLKAEADGNPLRLAELAQFLRETNAWRAAHNLPAIDIPIPQVPRAVSALVMPLAQAG
jgi:hypothetical protein